MTEAAKKSLIAMRDFADIMVKRGGLQSLQEAAAVQYHLAILEVELGKECPDCAPAEELKPGA